MIFDRLADSIQKHAKLIVVLWVVILCCAVPFAIKAGEVMSYDLNDMASADSESIKGMTIMSEKFPKSGSDTSGDIIVFYFTNQKEMVAAQNFVDDLNANLDQTQHITSILKMDPMTTGEGDGIILAVVALDISSGGSALTPAIRAFINDVADKTGFTGPHYLTGMNAIAYDMEHDAMEDVSRIDPFTVLMILILVGLFFRSFVSSATPPLTIGVAFAVTMALIFFIGQVLNIFFITNMLILVSMMGAGCDYCIFIIARYREELRSGLSHNDAVHQAIVWAGESISISGASVIIGFGAMSVCNYSMISTMGICLALGILIALIAALTLIPAIIQLVGDRIFWPTKLDAFKEGGKATKGWYAWCAKVGDAYFHKSAHFSLKHAKAIALVAVLITAPAAYVVLTTEDSYDMITAMLSGESGDGMNYIGEYADQGMVMPNYSIIEYKEPLAVVSKTDGSLIGTLDWNDNYLNNVAPTLPALYAAIMKDSNIAYVDGPFVWNDMLKKIDEAGITDTDAKIQFIKDNLSAKNALVFETALSVLEQQGMSADYLFEGPAGIIDSIFKEFDIDFVWAEEVRKSKSKGLSNPTEIINDIEQRFVEQHPGEASTVLSTIIEELRKNGVSDDMIVNGLAPTIDAVFASFPGSYNWDNEVARSKAKGLTDATQIVNDVSNRFSSDFPGAPAMLFSTMIDTMHSQGLVDDVLVYGFGYYIDPMISEILPGVTWSTIINVIKSLGITDPDKIIKMIVDRVPADQKQTVIDALNELYAQGVTNEMLVNGMGSTIDGIISSIPTEYDWNRAVAQSVASGHTDATDIINDVIRSMEIAYGTEASMVLSSVIDQIRQNGVEDDIIVFGFGYKIDEVFQSLKVQTTWEEMVAASKAKGLTDPDEIVADIVKTFEEDYSPLLATVLTLIIDTMHEKGLTNSVLVNGFGGVVDYVMNITTSMVGGDNVSSEKWNVTYLSLISATEMAAMSPRSMQSLSVITDAVNGYMQDNSAIVVEKWDTGTAMIMYEVSEEVQSQFTFIEILVVVLIIILLFIVMRSYLIPFRSVLTILMSISWTLAMTHLVFVDIMGAEVIWLIPLILLVICLGLGMDYDILLTTRIKENVTALGMTNDDAIYHAVTHTGSVITICGLIMGGAFGTLMMSGMTMLQEFGFALCFAILVDALIVRTYIVPAIMHLLGDWNWKGPGSKARLNRSESTETRLREE